MPNPNEENEKSESRRRFLHSSGRILSLGGLSLFTAHEIAKGRRLASDPNCIKLETCAECVEFGGCEKPKAENARSQWAA